VLEEKAARFNSSASSSTPPLSPSSAGQRGRFGRGGGGDPGGTKKKKEGRGAGDGVGDLEAGVWRGGGVGGMRGVETSTTPSVGGVEREREVGVESRTPNDDELERMVFDIDAQLAGLSHRQVPAEVKQHIYLHTYIHSFIRTYIHKRTARCPQK
jgi:hypothetical protein